MWIQNEMYNRVYKKPNTRLKQNKYKYHHCLKQGLKSPTHESQSVYIALTYSYKKAELSNLTGPTSIYELYQFL